MSATTHKYAPIKYRRILIIEDDYMIANQLARAFEALGGEVVGPTGSLGKAIQLVETAEFDCALVDINLRGVESYPVVDILMRRGVPVAFISGYDRTNIPDRYRSIPLIQKPVDVLEVASALAG
jgi:DNA-binding response OmpR family regulator